MKVILTEEQFKLLTEGYSNRIMSLKDLSNIVIRMGFDEMSIETFFYLFRVAYHNKGDDGVIELYKNITGHTIEPISKGKYVYSYN